jgi:hypothetical protein
LRPAIYLRLHRGSLPENTASWQVVNSGRAKSSAFLTVSLRFYTFGDLCSRGFFPKPKAVRYM